MMMMMQQARKEKCQRKFIAEASEEHKGKTEAEYFHSKVFFSLLKPYILVEKFPTSFSPQKNCQFIHQKYNLGAACLYVLLYFFGPDALHYTVQCVN